MVELADVALKSGDVTVSCGQAFAWTPGFFDGTTAQKEHADGHPDCADETGGRRQRCEDGRPPRRIRIWI
jgi:hypothetical protein